MNKFIFFLVTVLFLLSAMQCTSTRWTVADMHSIDEREEPEKLSSRQIIRTGEIPTVDRPFLTLNLYEIQELEFTERVLVERTVQQYQPRWGFTMLGTLGAAIAFYAANTDDFIDDPSSSQTAALNATGVLLTTIALANMKPVGEPIRTGETRHLRTSGTVVKPDTTRADEAVEFEFMVEINYRDETQFSQTYQSLDEDGLRVNLASLLDGKNITGEDPGYLDVYITYGEERSSYQIPITSFLSPVVVVNTPVTELRNEPVYGERNTLAEVGHGSELILLDKSDQQWFEVRFGGSDVYILRESGEIQWKAADIIADPTVVTVDEVPFGEISVEYSVPVLKPVNETDVGIILSNHRNNQKGLRRYLDRDFRLIELYYRDAFGVLASNFHKLDLLDGESFRERIESLESDSTSTIHLYISGFARVNRYDGEDTIEMIHVDEAQNESVVDLKEVLTHIASIESRKLVVFIDLEYTDELRLLRPVSGINNGTAVYRRIADSVLELNENSALIFSARPDQKSGIYESTRFEQKYHHIFPYYIAQGLQQRRATLSNLIRHIENQVDYTSRRLHDRPQTVQAFGNLTLNLAD